MIRRYRRTPSMSHVPEHARVQPSRYTFGRRPVYYTAAANVYRDYITFRRTTQLVWKLRVYNKRDETSLSFVYFTVL